MMMCDKVGYKALVKGDIDWLRKQPVSLERAHIETILEDSVNYYYPDQPSDNIDPITKLVQKHNEFVRNRTSETQLKENPIFIKGYDAGLKDGIASERMNQAERDQPSGEWISVEKEIPVIESPIWVCNFDTGKVWGAYVSDEVDRKKWIKEWGITHWKIQPVQSLPEPPKIKEK